MKNRKIALLPCIFLLSSNAYAHWQGNWLFGLSGSYADRRGELDIETTYTSLPGPFLPFIQPPVSSGTNQRYSDLGRGWGLLGGYQIQCNGWTWGIEGSIDWWDISTNRGYVYPDVLFANFSLVSWNVHSEYKRDDPFVAFSGRMAYEMAPYFIPYLRLGIGGSEESLDVTIVAGSNAFPSGAKLHSSRWVWHYLLGVGFEVPIWCTPITVRAEYNYHSRARPLEALSRINDGVINPVFNVQMSPITNLGKLSAVWNFC